MNIEYELIKIKLHKLHVLKDETKAEIDLIKAEAKHMNQLSEEITFNQNILKYEND